MNEDVGTGVVEAPAETVAVEAPEVTEAPAPEPFLNVSDAKASLMDIVLPSEEVGEPEPELESETPQELGDTDETVTGTVEAGEEAEVVDAPEGFTVLEVPEGHFYRDRGKTHIPVPEGWENEFRAFLNDPVRRAEVDDARFRLNEAQRTAKEMETAARFYYERAQMLATDPTVAMTVGQIAEEMGEDAAHRYLAGLFQEDQVNLSQQLEQARQAIATQQLEQEADAFIGGARNWMAEAYPHLQREAVDNLLLQFGDAYDRGLAPGRGPADAFQRYVAQFMGTYKPNTPVDRETLKKELLDEIRREAEEKAKAHASKQGVNPLGRAPQPGQPTPRVVESTQGMSVQDVKRSLTKF